MVQAGGATVMLVGVLDIPLIILGGIMSATLYQRGLHKHSVHWFSILMILVVSTLWINLFIHAGAGLDIGYPTVEINRTVAIPFLLSYILWFRAAGSLVFILVGRRTEQGGLLWVLRLGDRTEPIRPAWQTNKSKAENSDKTSREPKQSFRRQ